MSVSGIVKEYKKIGVNTKNKLNIKNLKIHIVCMVLSFLFSVSGFSSSFSPFGVAFTGSVPYDYILTSVVGSIIGYFVSLDSVSALRYTASILALTVISWSVKGIKSLKTNKIVSVVTVFVSLFVTGLAVVFSKDFDLFNLLVCFSESVVGGASVFVFYKAENFILRSKNLRNFTSKDITGAIIFTTLLLLSVKDVNLFGVYFSRIICSFLVLVCAFYSREAGGAISGICAGITMSLGSGNVMLLAIYSMGGLLAGVFSNLGRIACVVSFSLSTALVTAISYPEDGIAGTAVEIVVSAVCFVFLTLKFNEQFEQVFKPSITSPMVDSVRTDVVTKLKRASEFSKEICTSLTAVNDVLDKKEDKGIDNIPRKTKETVCGSCGLYDTCWGENFSQSKYIFDSLLDMKRKGIYLEYKTVPQGFASTCIRTENVSSNFNKLYSEAKTKEKLHGRVKEIHTLAAEQFVNMSALLESICDEVNEELYFDMDIAAKVKNIVADCGCVALNCCCSFNSQEKMKLEITIKKPVNSDSIKSVLKQINLSVNSNLELPEIRETEDFIEYIFKEKTDLKAVVGAVQHNSAGEKYSGDSYGFFTDDKGYFYAVICDGMGTGAKAAVSSSLAVSLLEKLIKAGFSVCSAVNTVNTSLISKSGDECSVTLDLFVLDLYTGRGEFYKCGASDSVVKRKGKIINIGFDSLPLGIINNIEISNGNGILSSGDVVVLCSDGVREEDYYILRKELKGFCGGDVKKFTEELCDKIRKNQPPKSDDLTIMIVAVAKNQER